MKHILAILVGVAVLYLVMFMSFSNQATVETPEIKKTGNYERPVKDGNCWIQTDTAGNKIRVCG